jgi:heterodisulfide reductase subunit A-like polyferredoxin
MANVRDQCSWVHSDDSEAATRKAKDLLRMAVARSRHLEPLHKESLSLFHSALVIGGGMAGMASALSLADQGYEVFLVEREEELGGRLRNIHRAVEGGDPQAHLRESVAAVEAHPKIEVMTGCQVVKSSGFVGNFSTTVRNVNDPTQRLIEHGVTIVATGGQEYRGPAYHLGEDPRVLTQGDFEKRLAEESALEGIRDVAMIQCAGPWNSDEQEEFYCSRICCDLALKNALRIKEINPSTNVHVFFKDVRVYGFREEIYTRAREAGIIFTRFEDGDEPIIRLEGGKLRLEAAEPSLGERISLEPDLLVLSTAIVPSHGSQELSEILKVPLSQEGFFLEAHPKLRPVDFPSEGLFLCGTAQYPKLLGEAIGQAMGAAARATTVLSQDNLMVGGVVAVVEEDKCVGCLTCIRVCPYDVPIINPTREGAGGILGVAEIEAAACQGCGICAGECPAKAIQLAHYRDEQIIAKALAVVSEEVA